MSVKFSLTLPDELMASVKFEAEESGESAAEFFRRAARERLERLRAVRPGPAPLSRLRGFIRDEEADLSSRVDEIVYGDRP